MTHTCTNPQCESVVADARVSAGYTICIPCAKTQVKPTVATYVHDEDGNPAMRYGARPSRPSSNITGKNNPT